MPFVDQLIDGYDQSLMDERRLEVFAAVAARRSFSDAARVLHLSQSAVSQHIAALEAELGTRLFDRTTRRVRPTVAGVALQSRVDALLRDYAEARRAVAAAEGRIAGDLRIAASLTIGAYVLPAELAGLVQHHPDVRLRMTIMNTEQVVDALLQGRVDVGFVEGSVQSEGIDVQPFRSDELVLIAPRGHRFASVDSVAVEDLRTEPFVLREEGSGTREVAETHLRAAGIAPELLRVAAVLSGIDAIKATVAAGLGVSIISRSALQDGGGNDGLIQRSIVGIRLSREMAAAFVAGAQPLPAALALVDRLRHAELAARTAAKG